jgi:signal transduction histidine kinase
VALGRSGTFRLKSSTSGSDLLVVGFSLAGDHRIERWLLIGEITAGPLLLLAMFAGALLIGLRAQAPVEQSRRRQLEFTADASHELRTPLSVIRAETDLALASPRAAADYRDTLTRIGGETERLRRLVEDMLWLARFDSQPPRLDEGPVDVSTVAQACADRFRSVGPAVTATATDEPALVNAPPEWMDRLAGVLLDNACRYAGMDGQVRIGVVVTGNRVTLTVEDSGPGIPADQRPRLFDRFSRATEQGSGAGLGLAIGDSVVRSTGGRWEVGDSSLGGARLAVSWRQAQPHRAEPDRRPTAFRS